jgi:cysteine-rich repeat protein
MMRDWRYGVWLLMAGGVGACDRCSWRLEYVEADYASAGSSSAMTVASSGADLTLTSSGEASMGSTSAGPSGDETASSGWTTGSGGTGTSETGISGADDDAPPPVCGDGVIDPGEECDDGNSDDEDACSNDCWAPRLVFVTAEMYPGKLGGIVGADQICMTAAMSAGLPVNFKAWISDGSAGSGPRERFDSVGFGGWYKLTNGKPLAHGWEGLGSPWFFLLRPINVTEYGATVVVKESSAYAWSNTDFAGDSAVSDDCGSWLSMVGMGRVGLFSTTGPNWKTSAEHPCGLMARLYCFQVG